MNRILVALVGLATALTAHAGAEENRPAPRLAIMTPAYFYPGGKGLKEWDRLIAAAKSAPIVAIANPASGPGKKRDPNYSRVIDRAREAGVTVIGYVSTRYAKRPHAEVWADVDAWVRFYPGVQGFFFDEQASDFKQVEHYGRLRAYARTKIPPALVVTNPGTVCDELFVKRSASDVVCLFENRQGFSDFKMPSWTKSYPARRYCALPYQVEDAAQMQKYVRQAVEQRFGYLYITDDGGRNPWDRLPSYWDEFVAAVSKANAAE